MEYIEALNKVKENYINILNDYKKEYSKYNDKFHKDNYDLDNVYNELSEIVPILRRDIINAVGSLSFASASIDTIKIGNMKYILLALATLGIYSIFCLIKDIKEYVKNYYDMCDFEDNVEIYKLNSKLILEKQKVIEDEIDKLNIALDFVKSLNAEEKEKYLSLNIQEESYER